MKKNVVWIQWGTASTRAENPDAVIEYSFRTPAELRAFLKGVEEGDGWLEYSQWNPDDLKECYSDEEDGCKNKRVEPCGYCGEAHCKKHFCTEVQL